MNLYSVDCPVGCHTCNDVDDETLEVEPKSKKAKISAVASASKEDDQGQTLRTLKKSRGLSTRIFPWSIVWVVSRKPSGLVQHRGLEGPLLLWPLLSTAGLKLQPQLWSQY